MKKKPTCYECKHLIDTFGNYAECGLSAAKGTHIFIDYYYWGGGSPDECPLLGEQHGTTTDRERKD